jgi:glycosyltransferase involved in cell wall biosynthesis
MEQRPLKKFIVITSIFQPTEAIEAFSRLNEYQLIVVGDKKTPAGWQYPHCTYLSVEDQVALSPALANAIPFNHYGRKMMGYCYALRQGADIIIDTDDDNIPYTNWNFPNFETEYIASREDLGWVNIYHYFSEQPIWPRGLPLRHINDKRDRLQWKTAKEPQKTGIWQGLADEDPDVDAIYRLTSDTPCIFKKKEPVVLAPGTVCPFNSQNTAFRKELFPLLYLPSFVTFRFTDILRGIIAQPILWQHGFRLGFTEATVVQKRNVHDYFRDFESEVPMYLHAEKSLDAVKKVMTNVTVKDNLYNAYEALLKINVVESREMNVLHEWLKLF